jgi:acetyl-CoA carboxylase biotin carboxylase subunit
MIGKLIVWGKDRTEAISVMKRALHEFKVEGIKTSIDFHIDMMKNEDFVTNRYDTKYLDSKLK